MKTNHRPIALIAWGVLCLIAILLAQARLTVAEEPGKTPDLLDLSVVQCPALVICSRDGAFYASAPPDGRIRYCRSLDGKVVRTLYHCSPRSLVFSTDGLLLACAGGANGSSGAVRVWDLRSGRLLCAFRTELAETPALAISTDGSLLAVTTKNSRLSLWELPEGKERWSAPLKSAIADVRFVEQDTAVQVRCDDNSVRLLPVDGAKWAAERP